MQIQTDEVEFETTTSFPDIFSSYYTQYGEEFKLNDGSSSEYPDFDNDDGDFYDLIGPEGMANVDNMIEG